VEERTRQQERRVNDDNPLFLTLPFIGHMANEPKQEARDRKLLLPEATNRSLTGMSRVVLCRCTEQPLGEKRREDTRVG
jgi:hypothetical protein